MDLRQKVFLIHVLKTEGPPHNPRERMKEIRLEELIWAGTWNNRNIILAADLYSTLGDTGHTGCQTRFGSHQTVHPDPLDTKVNTLLNDLIGDFRACENENRIRCFRNGF
jgi:hypothetical protein